ncbi:MAG: GFA family protein [Candidatus Poribacteria bacterium]|nr:GFA family protein [Candidatus Poribacteria bacterium]
MDEILGGCFCGNVRYRATPPLRFRALCHCETCRKASGAPYVTWITVKVENFEHVGEQPLKYRYDREDGKWAERSFCGKCGTQLTYQAQRRATDVDITVGSLDDPNRYPPNREVYPDEKLSWVDLGKTLHQGG